MEKPSYRPPPFFMGRPAWRTKKKSRNPRVKVPAWFARLSRELGPDGEIGRRLMQTMATAALTHGASRLGRRFSVRRLEAVG